MEDFEIWDWLDDGVDDFLARAARAEDEAEMALAPYPITDRSGINADCNESQPCRGDEPEEDDCDFGDDDDDELDSELDDLPL